MTEVTSLLRLIMNLTKYAIYRNAEFMVHVKDPQWVSSLEELIVHLFKDTGKDKNTDWTIETALIASRKSTGS